MCPSRYPVLIAVCAIWCSNAASIEAQETLSGKWFQRDGSFVLVRRTHEVRPPPPASAPSPAVPKGFKQWLSEYCVDTYALVRKDPSSSEESDLWSCVIEYPAAEAGTQSQSDRMTVLDIVVEADKGYMLFLDRWGVKSTLASRSDGKWAASAPSAVVEVAADSTVFDRTVKSGRLLPSCAGTAVWLEYDSGRVELWLVTLKGADLKWSAEISGSPAGSTGQRR